MDETGFRAFLATRNLAPEAVESSVAIVRRFEELLRRDRPDAAADEAAPEDVARFVTELAGTSENTEDNLLAVARYCRVVRNDPATVAALELIDGDDVPPNLSRKLAELAGEEARDEVFAGLVRPPIGAPPAERNLYMRALVDRLFARVDDDTATEALTSNLHFVPAEAYAEERKRYLAAPDLDTYLAEEHRLYVEYLTGLKDEGLLYYTQPITDDVVAYIRDTPTCGGGVRDGDVIRTTKIPYQADLALRETDEVRRRYYTCHCPWARESILEPDIGPAAGFCRCSAGYEKRLWDTIFDEPVKVDVLRSVLAGDDVCEFAVHVPAAALPGEAG
jgi:hypothetical protein